MFDDSKTESEIECNLHNINGELESTEKNKSEGGEMKFRTRLETTDIVFYRVITGFITFYDRI